MKRFLSHEGLQKARGRSVAGAWLALLLYCLLAFSSGQGLDMFATRAADLKHAENR